ncbi:MAG: TetR/AcrR family transcriptional regulator [Anaerolineae bacterium]|nr:TetR/AcrR family transcriptional regulator [Anaerolineae bacterium]
MTDKPLTKRQEQALKTKKRIYTAAVDLMNSKGFDNLTIADISKAADVSVGAFYHYFDSKNDILAEIFYQADEYFSTEVTADVEDKPALEQLVLYFDHYARFNVLSGVEMTRQLFSSKVKFFVEEGRPMQVLLRDIISAGQKRGEIRANEDPAELVRLLFVLARGVVFDWNLYDGSYDLEETMHRYIQRLVSTLTPE